MGCSPALFKYNGFMLLHKKAQAHLSKHDPVLAKLIAKYGDCTLAPHTDYYRELVDSIISQQLSVKAGRTIFNRFLDLYAGNMPTPKQIIETDIETLREVGCSYAKANYIKDLAFHIENGQLDLKHIAKLPNEEVIKQLVAVKGIGEWSAHMFMIFSLGRTNILPTGDLGIRNAMTRLYGLKSTKPDNLLQISLQYNWAPFQSVASWYLWKSLDNS
jgi:DNA-3-methyladenine glycosylase II